MAFIDMGHAYDRVDIRKLFEVMRGYGVHGILVDVIKRIYNGSMIKFEMGIVMNGWCKSDSGVRQAGVSLISVIIQHIVVYCDYDHEYSCLDIINKAD